MKLAKVGAAVAVMVFGGAAAMAAGSPNDRVTGGGQTLVGTKGAGNTVAFTIQGSGSDVKGQFQYVDRTAGTGQSQDSWHGSPVCLEVAGNTAKAIIERNDSGALYELLLVDNGQGAMAENDIVAVSAADDNSCEQDDDDDDADTELARGNIQVYDAP